MVSSGDGSSSRGVRLIVLVAALLVLAIVVGWIWRRAPGGPDIEAGRPVADEFLLLIRTGKAPQAWESTTAEFKSAEGRESFLKYVKEHPSLAKPMSFVSVQTVMLQESPRAEYVYRSGDGKATARVLIGDDLGTWRVDRFTVQ